MCGGGVTEASSVIPEEKPGMPVCHRAKSQGASESGAKASLQTPETWRSQAHGTVPKEAAAPPQEV